MEAPIPIEKFPRAIATAAARTNQYKRLGSPREWPPQESKIRIKMKTKLALIITLAGCFLCGNIFADPPLSGAIFTTDSTCSGVDLNIYADKHDVYLDGGPAHPGAARLRPGNKYRRRKPNTVPCQCGRLSGLHTAVRCTDKRRRCLCAQRGRSYLWIQHYHEPRWRVQSLGE